MKQGVDETVDDPKHLRKAIFDGTVSKTKPNTNTKDEVVTLQANVAALTDRVVILEANSTDLADQVGAVTEQVVTLKANVTTLTDQGDTVIDRVAILETNGTDLTDRVDTVIDRVAILETDGTDLSGRVVVLEEANAADICPAVSNCLSVEIKQVEKCVATDDPDSADNKVLFKGCNLQVVNNDTSTTAFDDQTADGTGNIYIGRNKEVLGITQTMTGSHTLVVGDGNSFTSIGGIVAGLRKLPHLCNSGTPGPGGSYRQSSFGDAAITAAATDRIHSDKPDQ